MTRKNSRLRLRIQLLTLTLLVLAPLAVRGQSSPSVAKRSITVADDIGMTRVVPDDTNPNTSGKAAYFSPDGKRFVVVLTKGNPGRDTNDSSLLLYNTADALQAPKPNLLLRMSSSSVREALSQIRWLADNDTLVFLGENPGEVSQIYSFQIKTKTLTKLTNQPTAISAYDITEDGRTLAFLADTPPSKFVDTEHSPAREIVVEGQDVDRIVAGDYSFPEGKKIFWLSLVLRGLGEEPDPSGLGSVSGRGAATCSDSKYPQKCSLRARAICAV